MPRQPAVRASAVIDTLEFLDQFEKGARQRVLDRVPASSRRRIEQTVRSSWVDVEDDHHTIDAIIALFGKPRAVAFWAAAVAELTNRPLLKPFVRGMFTLVPLHPHRVVSILATGWSLVYRDMCRLETIQAEAGYPVLCFAGIAPQIRDYSNYLASWQGGCEGFATLAGLSVRLDFRTAADLSQAEAHFIPETAA